MRPVELKVRNFRSYFGDEAAFDFRDRRLVGIVGPIGSGKSTILDAIAFALYGRTPSGGKSTKALIHQRADNAAVALRFEVDGEVWEAQRMLRRRGASQHALYRLADDSDDPEKVETITGEVEVTGRIAELLGLDYDAFGRSVMLAQGRFAEFLTARPAERDRVLKGVFGYDRIDRMRAAAKERARDAEIEAEKATVAVRHLAELEEATKARAEERSRDLGRLKTLEAIEPKIGELRKAIEASQIEERSTEQQLADLRALKEALPEEDEIEAVLNAGRSAAERRGASAERLDSAKAALEAAKEKADSAGQTRTALDTAVTLLGGTKQHAAALGEAEALLGRGVERAEQADAEAKGQRDRVSLAERGERQTATELAEASAAGDAAETAFHEATHANMAASLRRDLHEGEVCPVCDQQVMTVPAGSAKDADVEKAAAGLDEARQKRAEAEAARAAAIAALEASKIAAREADRRSQEAQAAVEGLEKGVETARKLAEEAGAELSALVGSDDGEAAISAMQEELAATAAALEDASAARDRAREDHDEAIQAEQATGKRVTDLRVALTTIAARLDDAPEVSDDVDSIGDAAATLRVMVEQSLGDTLQRRELAAAVAKDQRKALGSLIEAALITEPFDEALAALRSRVQVVGEEISRAEEQLADAADSRARRDAEVAAMKTYQALAGDLTDARFVRFLLDDERRRLAELGSEHFQRLSNGRYRFTEDGAFDVVDLTAADAVRKADSLSGGETFLASLGLALALAEIVSRGGGRLDAFFLDEGFGTLDSEHLDLAMEGIESLVSDEGNRLVVVVSHVPELRHRVEDLIELDRSPTTGDTRVLSA